MVTYIELKRSSSLSPWFDPSTINSLLLDMVLTEESRHKIRLLTRSDLEGMVLQEALTMFVAWNGEKVVGMVSMGIINFPSGKKAFIEDVVVDKKYRGLGIGKELMKRLIQIAKDASATSVELTSHPRRVAANLMYERLGFRRRETNMWRLDLRVGD